MLERELPHADALLISDYQSGTVTPGVVGGGAAAWRRALGTLVTVDAQGDFAKFRGVTVFRCNDREAGGALGVRLLSEAEFAAGLRRLRADWQTAGRGRDARARRHVRARPGR